MRVAMLSSIESIKIRMVLHGGTDRAAFAAMVFDTGGCLDELISQGVCIVLVDVVEYNTRWYEDLVGFRPCGRDIGKFAGVEKKQHITY